MSAGEPIRWAEAHAVATEVVRELADACDRIEIAGSIRRRRGEVHDIEIVAIPSMTSRAGTDLWGGPEVAVDILEELLGGLLAHGTIAKRDVERHRKDGTVDVGTTYGPSYRALVYRGMPVDLFITDPARWGCIFALRTGPGDWNQRLVTECKRWFRSVSDGGVLHLGRPVPTPEEADFFRALGVPWVDPWDRTPERLRFDPVILRAAG